MKRTILWALFSVCIVLIVTGCNQQTHADERVVLRFAYASNAQPVKDAMAKFGELVEEKTNGQVSVTYFPDGQLGGERELIELTQTGAIDMTKVGGSALESFSDKYSVFGIPYLFDDIDHFVRVMENQEIMKPIYQSTKDLGFIGLTYYNSGQRSFYLTDGPVQTPEDIEGKKIRVMESETAIRMIELLGGTAVPLGSGEVFTSIQQGIIDGAENNEFALVTAGHGDVASYYSYDEHTRVPDIVIMNDNSLEQLTKDQQQAIQEAAKESTEYEKEVWNAAVEAEKNEAVEEYDVEFNEVEKEPFLEKVQPIHETFKQDEELGKIYQAIRDASNNSEGE
ncbi:tripartite ATP-independent transporter solute receptor, DctP family [Gracilibacillus orientalis]|uniref:Tripartite ATP-independent transporter solute receptor, DctP family n=1 Tax=Gracilibacillus orientalis TaxID=334253 RepID=A0A1I4HZ26_9BACI|nr:TRAP transporter substrate-binding protein [Gracilibacillus orientalis]SFL47150.1 tripartite ATP-independent transporter solute receptor, DctP family [Gracilibacillus orientalis]